MIRTYHHQSLANQGKIETLKELAVEYRSFFNFLHNETEKAFIYTGDFDKYLSKENIFAPSLFGYYASKLSTRYKQTVNNEVKSNFKSKLSNIENSIIKAVMHSSLKKEEKIKVLFINKYHVWFKKDVFMQGVRIEDQYLKLSRKLFKRFNNKTARKSLTMILDANVAEVSQVKKVMNKKGKRGARRFDCWVKVSTLDSGKPIYLPFNEYDYCKNKNGKTKKVIQIIFNNQKGLTLGIVKDTEFKNNGKKNGIIAIDVGLKHIIIQNDGTKHGSDLLEKLKKLDLLAQNCMKGLQKRGLSTKKGSSKRLDNILRRISSLIKNEVGKAVNLVIAQNPEMIVMEDLTDLTYDLSTCNFSKKLKRLIANSAMAKVDSLMQMRCEEKGIELKRVNRAYTSQECYECFHTEKANRSGENFNCKKCGHKDHADVNASKVILRRSSLDLFSIYTPFREVKAYLNELSLLFYKNGGRSPPIDSEFKDKILEIKSKVNSRLIKA